MMFTISHLKAFVKLHLIKITHFLWAFVKIECSLYNFSLYNYLKGFATVASV